MVVEIDAVRFAAGGRGGRRACAQTAGAAIVLAPSAENDFKKRAPRAAAAQKPHDSS